MSDKRDQLAGGDRSRIEKDSMGEVQVPQEALYGAQTQRAAENFAISSLRMPRPFIRALGLIKAAVARTNEQLGALNADMAEAIALCAEAVARGDHDGHFVVNVFQTGSGTSSNMNANEVIASLATEQLGKPVHPNDHVNRSQSSNDVIPTAVHLSAALTLEEQLLPALNELIVAIDARARELSDVVKTGRTHLMDALPLTMGQELGAWVSQIRQVKERLESTRLHQLAQGATAVGTGLNSTRGFAAPFAACLSEATGLSLKPADDPFTALACQDTAVELSGQLRVAAVALNKIANDLRWMNSGPPTDLAEIALPALQPGSSIMPGKVNPVIPEAVMMARVQVMGNDACVTIAGQTGSFQLNVMLPVVAYNLLQSIEPLTTSSRALADKAISGFVVNEEPLKEQLARNPILVTALNNEIGYERGAAIAKRAYAEARTVREVAAEMTELSDETLARLLDPANLTKP